MPPKKNFRLAALPSRRLRNFGMRAIRRQQQNRLCSLDDVKDGRTVTRCHHSAQYSVAFSAVSPRQRRVSAAVEVGLGH